MHTGKHKITKLRDITCFEVHFKFAAELGMCCKCYVTTSSQDGSTTKLAMCFNVTCSSYSL